MATLTVIFTDMAYEIMSQKPRRSPEWQSLAQGPSNASSAVMARVQIAITLNSHTQHFCFSRRPENGQDASNGSYIASNCAEQAKKKSNGYLFTHFMDVFPGAVLDTIKCRRDIYMDFAAKPHETEKALAYAKATKLDPPDFRSLGSNCTTFANKVMAEAGIDLGNLTGKNRLMRRPSDVLRLFQRMAYLLEPNGKNIWIGEVGDRPVQLVFLNKDFAPALD